MADRRDNELENAEENPCDKKRRRFKRANLVLLIVACVVAVLAILFAIFFVANEGFKRNYRYDYDVDNDVDNDVSESVQGYEVWYDVCWNGLYLYGNSYDGLTVSGVDESWLYENDGKVEIPSEYDGVPVTTIWYGAFEECEALTTVVIYDGVTTIDDRAFMNCTFLESVNIPDSVESIGVYAFYGCSNLTEITIPENVTSIADGSFWYCTSLTQINYNATEANVSSDCRVFNFSGLYACDIEVTATIGSNVKNIPSYLFYQANIYNLVFEEGSECTSIGNRAFQNTEISSVIIPNGVVYIGSGVFLHCVSLNYIYIPESVISIGDDAFKGCTSLTIYAEAHSQPEGWNSDWNPNECEVYWKSDYTFETNGGSAVDAISAWCLFNLPTIEKDGYLFAGCYTDPGFSDDSKVSAPYYSATDVTLYARWIDLNNLT